MNIEERLRRIELASRVAMMEEIDMGAAHAPKGGITIKGTFFRGGEFITGEEVAKATPEQKALLGQRDDAPKEEEKEQGWGDVSPHNLHRLSMKPRNHFAYDTATAYKTTDGSQWDEERVKKVHEPIIAAALKGVKPSKIPGKPTLYVTGGGWGSGKSTLLDKFPELVGFPKGDEAVRADPDQAKAGIPEYAKYSKVGSNEFWPEAAGFVHEESAHIAKQEVDRGLAGGMDVVYDTSGDNGVEKLAAKIAKCRRYGAKRVEANYAFSGSIEESWNRAQERGKKTGRFVPKEALIANQKAVAKTWFAAAQRKIFDKQTLWSTAGEFGSPPKLVASVEGGKIQVHDKKMFDAFKQLAG